MVAITQRQIELSRLLRDHFPWIPKVGDTYCCRGTQQVIWTLPAPCHPEDFLIWGLYEAKHWLHERGMDDLEFVQSKGRCAMTARNRSTDESISAAGTTDVEAALEGIATMLPSASGIPPAAG